MNPLPPNPPTLAHLDWYAATVPTAPHTLLTTLAESLQGTIRETRGMHGYRQGFEVETSGNVVARALVGGKNGHPHAFASGQDAALFAEIIRREFPDHKVTRLDSAIDLDGEGCWDRVTAAALALADRLGLTVNYAGDWHRNEAGRTIYIGSRKSAVFLRIYEKGKQLGAPESLDWVRVELVVRPDGDSKLAAATATPMGVWGYSAWSIEFASVVFETEVPRVAIQVRRERDDERAMKALTAQYWRVLESRAAAAGGWSGLGIEIGQYIAKLGREAD